MTVKRDGTQTQQVRSSHRSHVSGKRQNRFAVRIKDNLDLQCERLERELAKAETQKEGMK